MFRRIISSAKSIRSKSSASSSSSYLPTHHNGNTATTKIPLDKKLVKKPSKWSYWLLVLTFLVYAMYAGWYAATRPKGKWKSPFSWHPFLMTMGMVGSMGIAAITKKRGGYTNTKAHAILASSGYLLALGGLIAIYHNKNLWNKAHFTTPHGRIGISIMASTLVPLLAGAVVLHPDFGIDKGNKTVRKFHKVFSRILMAVAWGNSLYGLYGMRKEHPTELLLYGIPLIILMPQTLI